MELRPYQKAGVDWLVDTEVGGLFDEPGLGKTPQAIVGALRVTHAAGRVLVVAPPSVTFNWRREIDRWSGGINNTQVVTKARDTIDRARSFVVVPHSLMAKPSITKQILEQDWAVCAVDECHAFKSPNAKRTQALYSLRDGDDSITAHCDRVWLLSGTPMPNHPDELWTHLRGLNPNRILKGPSGLPGDKVERPMTWMEFRSRFCTLKPSRYAPGGLKPIGVKNLPELKRVLDGFSLRRKKRDVLPELKPVDYQHIELTPAAETATYLAEMSARIDPIELREAEPEDLLSVLSDQLGEDRFSTWRRMCGLAKAAPAAEVVENDLLGGVPKALVVCHHEDVIEKLCSRLQSFAPLKIVGGMTARERDAVAQTFNTNPDRRLLIINIVAGGTGINLQAACSDLYFVEQSFVPGENTQAVDRLNRFGQERGVVVRFLSVANGVDSVCADILTRKAQMIAEVIE